MAMIVGKHRFRADAAAAVSRAVRVYQRMELAAGRYSDPVAITNDGREVNDADNIGAAAVPPQPAQYAGVTVAIVYPLEAVALEINLV